MTVREKASTRSRHAGSGHSTRHAGVSGVRSTAVAVQDVLGVSNAGGAADSRAVSGARLTDAFLELGVVQSYDAGSNTAMVQLLGAQASTVGPLAVNKAISSGLMVAGAQCMVVLMDANNPSDGALVSVW